MSTPVRGLMMLHPDEVRPSPDNPRRTLDGIEDLAASIEQVGLLQPITVQPLPGGGYEVVTGHRRLAAMKLLCRRAIPALVRPPTSDAQVHAARIVENDQRASLDPIDEAESLQKFIKAGATQAQVATMIGRSVAYVASRLTLLDLDLAAQEKVRAGHWSINYANGLVREAREKARRTAQQTDGAPPRRPGRPVGSTTKPYFGDTHPLAETARARCTSLHRGAPKLGGVACGSCYEAVIRDDERQRLTTELEGAAS